jgi:hypothetical protein
MAGTIRTVTGKVLTVTLEGVTLSVRKSKVTRKVAEIDTTSVLSAGYEDAEAGLKSAMGDFEAVVPVATPVDVTEGQLGTFVVSFGGRVVTLTDALITQVEDTSDYKGERIVSGNFRNRGAYTVA